MFVDEHMHRARTNSTPTTAGMHQILRFRTDENAPVAGEIFRLFDLHADVTLFDMIIDCDELDGGTTFEWSLGVINEAGNDLEEVWLTTDKGQAAFAGHVCITKAWNSEKIAEDWANYKVGMRVNAGCTTWKGAGRRFDVGITLTPSEY